MAGTEAIAQAAGSKRSAALTLAALGVVFGDIGTSPLYTVKECFSEFTGIRSTHDNVLGILSLITWALILVVTLKYVLVVMRADNRGEGGVLALMALVSRQEALSERRRRVYLMVGMAGAALFYGDCLLTPAISVLSAVEGLKVATPAFAAAGRADRARRAGRAVRGPAPRHRRSRTLVRPDHAPLVRRAVRAGPAPDRRASAGAGGVPAASRRRVRPAPRLRHLPRPGRRDAGRHRRRGALCRHGPFRPRAHPPRLAVAGAARAARQLLRPGRAAAGRRHGARESVLPPRARLGALSAGGARHGRHRDRLAGHHLRRLLDGAAGGAAGLQPARAHPAHLGQRVRPDLRAGASTGCCWSAWWRW